MATPETPISEYKIKRTQTVRMFVYLLSISFVYHEVAQGRVKPAILRTLEFFILRYNNKIIFLFRTEKRILLQELRVLTCYGGSFGEKVLFSWRDF